MMALYRSPGLIELPSFQSFYPLHNKECKLSTLAAMFSIDQNYWNNLSSYNF